MSEEENKILQCIEEYLKEYADDYQKIVVEGGMFGDSIEFTAGYRFMKKLMGYIKKQDKEIERLNNIIKKAIHFINLNQDPKKLTLNYDDLKKLRGILNNDKYYLTLFEEQLKELKENK